MVDTPITIDPAAMADAAASADSTAQSLSNLGSVANNVQDHMNVLSDVVKGAKNRFDEFTASMGKVGVSLNQNHALSAQQTTQFGLLATAVFGSQKAFEGLAGVDTKSLSTFGDQIGYLTQNLGQGKNAVGALVRLAEEGFGAIVPNAAKKSVGAMKSFLSNLTESADNSLRLQNAVIQLAAKTGTLNDVYNKTGPTLGKMNSLLASQNAIMDKAQASTGLGRTTIDQYYASLGAVPKALQETVSGVDNASNSMSMLTATIKLATGSGRDYDSIIKDLHTAFTEYGITGENALIFTARFSEISSKFGVELDIVHSGLIGATSAFKNMTDAGAAAHTMTEGLAGVMNDYVGGLMKAGMSGQHAVDTIKDMTDNMSRMGIAQKAFLSAQTGGPGGLMGGFQIEKMIREGNVAGVQDKVMQTMQKQFGKITTLDEAGQSEQGAAQLQKQITMLKQGPLGQMVKSDQDAYKLLESMRARQDGRAAPATPLDQKGLQSAIAKGSSIEEKSFTQLTSIRQHLESIRRSAETSNLGFLQQGLTASTGGGSLGTQTPAQRESQRNLTKGMAQADTSGGKLTATHDAQMKAGGQYIDSSGKIAANTITDFQKWFNTIPKSLAASMDVIQQAISTGKKENIPAALDQVRKDIADKRASLQASVSGMSKEDIAKQTAQINLEEKTNNQASSYFKNSGSLGTTGLTAGKSQSSGAVGEVNANMEEANFGSATLENATTSSVASAGNKSTTAAPSAAAIPSGGSGGSNELNIHLTGTCIDCGRKMENSDHRDSMSPTAKVSP